MGITSTNFLSMLLYMFQNLRQSSSSSSKKIDKYECLRLIPYLYHRESRIATMLLQYMYVLYQLCQFVFFSRSIQFTFHSPLTNIVFISFWQQIHPKIFCVSYSSVSLLKLFHSVVPLFMTDIEVSKNHNCVVCM